MLLYLLKKESNQKNYTPLYTEMAYIFFFFPERLFALDSQFKTSWVWFSNILCSCSFHWLHTERPEIKAVNIAPDVHQQCWFPSASTPPSLWRSSTPVTAETPLRGRLVLTFCNIHPPCRAGGCLSSGFPAQDQVLLGTGEREGCVTRPQWRTCMHNSIAYISLA